MVERKLYKTRLCVLFTKGHCPRQTCSFAHGDAELRRFNTSSSFNGRRDYCGSDLRDKIGRRHSPPRRNSLDRDARDRYPSRGHDSLRLGKTRNRQHFDGESYFSGSLRMSDGAEDQAKDRKLTSSEFKNVHDEQLKRLESEIDLLEDDKQHLEIYLEERVQEADSLNSKIKELEMQLFTEKEECKRISSKIRKFVKAYNRHSRIQDDLKRSEARLQKLGEHLVSDIRYSATKEDISINILSEEETLGNHLMGPRNEQHKNAYPSKKRLRTEANEGLKHENATKRELNTGSLVNEGKPRQGKNILTSISSTDKLKDSKSGVSLPITGITAHAIDELVEVVELDDKFEAKETDSTKGEKGLQLPLPPPPPFLQKAYLQRRCAPCALLPPAKSFSTGASPALSFRRKPQIAMGVGMSNDDGVGCGDERRRRQWAWG